MDSSTFTFSYSEIVSSPELQEQARTQFRGSPEISGVASGVIVIKNVISPEEREVLYEIIVEAMTLFYTSHELSLIHI